MTAEYDIIIPAWIGNDDLAEKAQRCLETIAEHSAGARYRVIWIDNGSPCADAAAPALERVPHLLVRNNVNIGFIRATNQGLMLSTAPYLVLMNDDTEAVQNWLLRLRAPLLDPNVNVGASGPRTNTLGSWQGNFRIRRPANIPVILSQVSMLAFFCTMLRREVLEKVGYLNEAFGVGFGDDDEYCRRIHQAGFRLALVQDLLIPHHHRTTFHAMFGVEKTRQMQQRAIALFKQTCQKI